MAERIIDCGGGFWNVRSSFRLFGLIDIGAHVSLVQLGDGGFVILDSASFGPDLQARVDAITGGRENVLAVVNTHPFHTVHTVAMHEAYPGALHFGTIRHRRLFPDLAWAETISEDPVTWAYFSPALAFTVPAGVELVPKNERVHCGAVLAWHEGSRTALDGDYDGHGDSGHSGARRGSRFIRCCAGRWSRVPAPPPTSAPGARCCCTAGATRAGSAPPTPPRSRRAISTAASRARCAARSDGSSRC